MVKRPPPFLISYRSRRGHHGSKKGDKKKPVIKQVLKLDVSNKREGQRLKEIGSFKKGTTYSILLDFARDISTI